MKARLFDGLLGRFRRGVGRVLQTRGRYRFVRLLGRGGMGDVWLAEKIGAAGFSKLVAIKTIRATKLKDRRTREMFMDEARLVANLVHPNLVQVYQLTRNRREVFYVMEHVFGVTLLQLLDRLKKLGRELPADIGAYITARICRGLWYAHNKHDRTGRHLGVVHRDICPSNILLSFRGIPKLGDFGVAKATISSTDDELDTVWGKYPYMAPEAVRRTGTEARSDLYSLGLVMYEMFTGQLAHDAGDTSALNHLIEETPEEELDIRRYAPHLPEAMARIVLKACRHDIDERYLNAKEMALDLEQFCLQHWLFPDEERVADFLADLFPQAEKHRWW